MVHLDIKPANILITKNGDYKLVDLGHARKSSIHSSEYLNEGDGKYMAYELFRNKDKSLDLTKADIYSLGVSIYELIIGEDLMLVNMKS